ncbi:MAG: MFS transporter, partial [Bacteroidales bacterium]|nr:MFS transporter [Bacteroidales bacterium]
PIRVFGTVGFIISMWVVDLAGFQQSAYQFVVSGGLGIIMAAYSFTMPTCPTNKANSKSFVEALGLKAFSLFKQKKMAIFFIFSVLLGVSLQITNGFANPFITSFENISDYADTFGVKHANILISLSQMSETLCILLIPFCMKRFGIKKVMLISMFAWVLRFGFFGLGNPGTGVWLFVLSCIVYGVAFDFFNVSGSLFVDKETDSTIRSSAQGLFFLMTNGIGSTVGTLGAQAITNHFVFSEKVAAAGPIEVWHGWQTCWYIFAAYSLVVAILFAICFKYKHEKTND